MVLRWLIEATSMRVLARESGVSTATAYQHPHESLVVITDMPPT